MEFFSRGTGINLLATMGNSEVTPSEIWSASDKEASLQLTARSFYNGQRVLAEVKGWLGEWHHQ
jgi:hypothetical protein